MEAPEAAKDWAVEATGWAVEGWEREATEEAAAVEEVEEVVVMELEVEWVEEAAETAVRWVARVGPAAPSLGLATPSWTAAAPYPACANTWNPHTQRT